MITSLTRSLVSSKSWYRSMLAGNDAYNPGSFDLISTTILGSTTASVTFDVSTLASTYKHLQIRMSTRSDRSGGATISYKYNSDTGSNYTMHYLQGNGSSVASGAYTALPYNYYIDIASASTASNNFTPAVMDIADAFSTSKNKTSKVFWGGDPQWTAVNIRTSVWLSTSAITSIQLYEYSGANFVAGSRFSIYGIKG